MQIEHPMSDLLWLASLTKFNGFKVHPCCRIYQDLISFCLNNIPLYGYIIPVYRYLGCFYFLVNKKNINMNICEPICVCVLKYVLNSIWYITRSRLVGSCNNLHKPF